MRFRAPILGQLPPRRSDGPTDALNRRRGWVRRLVITCAVTVAVAGLVQTWAQSRVIAQAQHTAAIATAQRYVEVALASAPGARTPGAKDWAQPVLDAALNHPGVAGMTLIAADGSVIASQQEPRWRVNSASSPLASDLAQALRTGTAQLTPLASGTVFSVTLPLVQATDGQDAPAGQAHAARILLAASSLAVHPVALLTWLEMIVLFSIVIVPGAIWFTFGRHLAREHDLLVTALATDDLTGLGHGRALPGAVASAIATARRNGRPLSVVTVELTGLHSEQQTVGRAHADALTVAAAGIVRRERPTDRIFRTGDAFTVILPGMDAADAHLVAFTLSAQLTDTLAVETVAAPCTLDERCTDAETLLIGLETAVGQARRAALPSQTEEVWDLRYLTD